MLAVHWLSEPSTISRSGRTCEPPACGVLRGLGSTRKQCPNSTSLRDAVKCDTVLARCWSYDAVNTLLALHKAGNRSYRPKSAELRVVAAAIFRRSADSVVDRLKLLGVSRYLPMLLNLSISLLKALKLGVWFFCFLK